MVHYHKTSELPEVIPVFPLPGAMLFPRWELPLNIFEPRYLNMFDDAMRGDRIIGMIQSLGGPRDRPNLARVGCAGRIIRYSETDDGRYLVTLSGICRFAVDRELDVTTPYRQARVTYDPYIADFTPRMGEDEVDRPALLRALKEFAAANELKIDWKGVNSAPNEALVNALSMMCPFGTREKQALLEAVDLKTRADVLVAITEIELARGGGDPEATLQ